VIPTLNLEEKHMSNDKIRRLNPPRKAGPLTLSEFEPSKSMKVEIKIPEIVKGKATRRLAEMLPIETLQYYVRHYWFLKAICLPDLVTVFAEGLISTAASLEKQVRVGSVTEEKSKEILLSYAIGCCPSPLVFTLTPPVRPGPKKDMAFNFLLYVVFYDLKELGYTSNGVDEDLCELFSLFLDNQGIERPVGFGSKAARSRLRRITSEDIFKWYDFPSAAFPHEYSKLIDDVIIETPFLRERSRHWASIITRDCVACAGSEIQALQCTKIECGKHQHPILVSLSVGNEAELFRRPKQQ
jgi:hypothetical protein